MKKKKRTGPGGAPFRSRLRLSYESLAISLAKSLVIASTESVKICRGLRVLVAVVSGGVIRLPIPGVVATVIESVMETLAFAYVGCRWKIDSVVPVVPVCPRIERSRIDKHSWLHNYPTSVSELRVSRCPRERHEAKQETDHNKY